MKYVLPIYQSRPYLIILQGLSGICIELRLSIFAPGKSKVFHVYHLLKALKCARLSIRQILSCDAVGDQSVVYKEPHRGWDSKFS